MSAKVLVAYVTRYGSTREVAENVATTLRERGMEADVRPAREVDTLEGYAAVVLGAPFYIGSLLKDTQSFLARHREALATRPLAMFTLGPLRGGDTELQEARKQLTPELAKTPWLSPVALEMFGGKYDPAHLRFLDKLLAVMPGTPLHGQAASDVRDWTAVRAWAGEVAAKLQPTA